MGGMTGDMMQPPAGTGGPATAMGQFIASSMNVSGVTAREMQPLVDKLSVASGVIH